MSRKSRPQQSLTRGVFSPHTLSADKISASLNPRFSQPVPPDTKQEILEAYLHPALAQRQEIIWLARDPAGVSKNEVEQLRENLGIHGVEVTDEAAIMNKKGKVEWNASSVGQTSLWEEPVVY